ncbi:TlpA family protein disulfide reductase [Carboxylicivirga sp. RSCT41]|uniref:TlpA family protein disulfide reductase n=1 Tax=Carboxylicivirga agarovorans TaxID=3417570 RepID=UPI003D346B31
MRVTLIISIFALLLFTQCKNSKTTINFEVKNGAEIPLFMTTFVEERYLIDTLRFDEKDQVMIELNENQLEKLSFRYDKTTIRPYLKKGDQVRISLENGTEKLSVSFSGDKAIVNKYKFQREKELNYGLARQLYGDQHAKKPFLELSQEIDELHKIWTTKLDKLSKEDKLFVVSEENYLDYYFKYIKAVYPWYMSRQTGNALDSDIEYNAFVSSLSEHEADESVEMYYQIFDQKISWKLALEKAKRNLGDSTYLVHMELINDNIKSSTLKNRLLSNAISAYLSWGINNLLEPTFSYYMQSCTDMAMKERVEGLYTNAVKLMPGQPAPDFEMYTKDGEKVMLSDFKGKFVYFDVWATWCGPCKAEIPYLAKLVEEFKNEERLEIISISVDSSHKAWVEMIEDDQPEWKQFIVKDAFNSALAKQYNISGIPQFVLIDADGNIVDVQAARPSNPNLLATLKALVAEK